MAEGRDQDQEQQRQRPGCQHWQFSCGGPAAEPAVLAVTAVGISHVGWLQGESGGRNHGREQCWAAVRRGITGRWQAAASKVGSSSSKQWAEKVRFSIGTPFLKKHHPLKSCTASEMCWCAGKEYTNWRFDMSTKNKPARFILNKDRRQVRS